MREILFRGRRLDNGEWVEGYYMRYGWTGDIKDRIMMDGASALYAHEVDPATVGQFTGIEDKNGKKIFEGNAVRVEYLHNGTSESEIRTVRWDDTNSGYAPLNWNEYCEGCDENTEIVSLEVIDNIHKPPKEE